MFNKHRICLLTSGMLATIAGGALMWALPAAAAPIDATTCAAQAGRVAVRAVAIAQGNTIQLQQTLDGTYQGEGSIEVYCQGSRNANLGEITDTSVQVTINPTTAGVTSNMFTITGENGVGVTNVNASTPGNPVLIGPFTGEATFLVTGASNLLPPGIAELDVAMQYQVVADAWGLPLKDSSGAILHPGTQGDIIAQTPELDSLLLFGPGAAGLLGYAGLRLRARRGRTLED